MKKIAFSLITTIALTAGVWAGTEYSGKEMKQVVPPPPCPEWYADTEWNVSLWGTYASTAENWEDDGYFLADHGWGGGADLKFFFHRYFGIGIEGFGLSVDRRGVNFVEDENSILDPE